MKSLYSLFRAALSMSITSMIIGCGSKGGGGPAPTFNPYSGNFAANVMPVVVGACGPDGYANEPCTTLKICAVGTSDCQTVDNILVDTGSYGLRIFSSQIKVGLKQVQDSRGNAIGECAQFGTSNTWGPVQIADVVLSGEPAVSIPIQVIDSTFKTLPANCTSPDVSAQDAGYNGILGVGLLTQDCGLDCASNSLADIYFSCDANSCTSTKLALDKQVVNPVSKLPVDNNGVILELPAVSDSGETIVHGTLTLGIGTAANNVADEKSLKVFAADSAGDFITEFQNHIYQSSFIDSGSNGLFFPETPDLPHCSSTPLPADFYCPANLLNFTAVQQGATGTTRAQVNFGVANAKFLLNSFGPVVGAFNNLGGTQTGAFDWGLPFFFGRKVYVAIEAKKTNLGPGPYWAW